MEDIIGFIEQKLCGSKLHMLYERKNNRYYREFKSSLKLIEDSNILKSNKMVKALISKVNLNSSFNKFS